MKRLIALFVFCMACGSNQNDNNVNVPVCEEIEQTFDVDSGWGASD